jgi:hypothetical protein
MITTSGQLHFTIYFESINQQTIAEINGQVYKGAHALNQRYITWPWRSKFRNLENFKILFGKLNGKW